MSEDLPAESVAESGDLPARPREETVEVPAGPGEEMDTRPAELVEAGEPVEETAALPAEPAGWPEDETQELVEEEPAPGIRARALTVRAGRRTIVGPLDLDVPQGSLVVVEGTAGSGRSTLLLALTGRMRGVGGELEVAGVPGTQGRRLRARTSVARISDLIDVDDPLTVTECVTERCLTDGVPAAQGSRRMSLLEDELGFRVPREETVGDLSQLVRTLLLVLLAQLRPADLVVLDDLDTRLSPADQELALAHLARFAATGPTVVVSTISAPPVLPPGTRLVHLDRTADNPGEVLP